MERTPVDSSNVANVGYDEQAQVLEIEFGSNATRWPKKSFHYSVYQYSEIPKWIYEELMAAPSKGKYLDRHVKKGGYRYERVE